VDANAAQTKAGSKVRSDQPHWTAWLGPLTVSGCFPLLVGESGPALPSS
jgi:hypothetical protein